MITQSGVHVFPTDQNAPTIEDIAVALGRIPRFGGHTRGWWPVLLHSIVCEHIAAELGKDRYIRGVMLIHDGHEAVTEDVPTYWKPPALKAYQRELDRRIFGSLGIHLPTDSQAEVIRHIDQVALFAEACVVGPPGIVEYYGLVRPYRFEHVVEDVVERYGKPQFTCNLKTNAVRWYITAVRVFVNSYRPV